MDTLVAVWEARLKQRRPEAQIEVAALQAGPGDGGSRAGGARGCQPEDRVALGLGTRFLKAAGPLALERLHCPAREVSVCACTPTETVALFVPGNPNPTAPGTLVAWSQWLFLEVPFWPHTLLHLSFWKRSPRTL